MCSPGDHQIIPDMEVPTQLFVPVGEFLMRRVRVPSGSPVRAPGRANGECARKRSFRGFLYKQTLNEYYRPKTEVQNFSLDGGKVLKKDIQHLSHSIDHHS